MGEMMNVEIARRLDEVAALLSEQRANPFRIQAYRHAADTVRNLPRSLTEIVHKEGLAGLHQLPGIGDSLARSLQTLVTTGRLPMLQRLRGEVDADALLASVPGIGQVLAQRLHHEVGIDTLEELEAAAYNGHLTKLAGIGPKRLAGIIDAVAARLGRVRYGLALYVMFALWLRILLLIVRLEEGELPSGSGRLRPFSFDLSVHSAMGANWVPLQRREIRS